MKIQQVNLIGLRADQPAAASTNIGFLYYVTDEQQLERSNGTTWEEYAAPPGGGGGGSPGGGDNAIQYNEGGDFTGGTTLNFDPDTVTLIVGESEGSQPTIKAADGISARGSDLTLLAGLSTGGRKGANIEITASDGDDDDGGEVTINSGSGTVAGGNGGDMGLFSGGAGDDGIGGEMRLEAGNGGEGGPLVLRGGGSSVADVGGNIYLNPGEGVTRIGAVIFGNMTTPVNSTDPGEKGAICWDGYYIYICVDTDLWVRTALSTW